MKDINMISKTIFEIAQALAENPELQRLLVIDSPDVLKTPFRLRNLNELLKDEYISLAPFVENGKIEIKRNTLLLVRLEDISFEEEEAEAKGSIYIATDKDHVLIDDNKNRLFEMINQILHSIDSRKFSAAGKVEIYYTHPITYSEFTFGYRIMFRFSDQFHRKAEL